MIWMAAMNCAVSARYRTATHRNVATRRRALRTGLRLATIRIAATTEITAMIQKMIGSAIIGVCYPHGLVAGGAAALRVGSGAGAEAARGAGAACACTGGTGRAAVALIGWK